MSVSCKVFVHFSYELVHKTCKATMYYAGWKCPHVDQWTTWHACCVTDVLFSKKLLWFCLRRAAGTRTQVDGEGASSCHMGACLDKGVFEVLIWFWCPEQNLAGEVARSEVMVVREVDGMSPLVQLRARQRLAWAKSHFWDTLVLYANRYWRGSPLLKQSSSLLKQRCLHSESRCRRSVSFKGLLDWNEPKLAMATLGRVWFYCVLFSLLPPSRVEASAIWFACFKGLQRQGLI